jgi:hypothetical protein
MKPGRIGWPHACLVSLLVAAGAGCSAGGPETPEPAARTIRVVSGNYQQGGLGAPLAEPVVFQVCDLGGAPLPGAQVSFRVVAGGGQVGASEAVDQACTAYAYANTELRLETGWISGVTFYRNFSEPLGHDGHVFESNAFLTFSDASIEEMKVLFSKAAEEDLREIMASLAVGSAAELGISGNDFRSKIKVYANRRLANGPGAWIGVQNSAIIFDAIDSPRLPGDLASRHRYVRRGLKHEITHIVQLLIIGPQNILSAWPPVWFTEGLAEHESAGVSSCPAPITTVAMLDAWFADPDHSRHPLELQDFEDIPANQGCQYYALFGLVVDFLLDPQGGGRTGADVKDMLLDLAQRHDFAGAFANHMGMSVAYLHDNLRDLLAAWLESRDGGRSIKP